MATNTFTQVSGANTGTAANWDGGLPPATGGTDDLVFGDNATVNSNFSGGSVDLNGKTVTATVAHTITTLNFNDNAGGGTIHGAVGQLITITGAFNSNNTNYSYLNLQTPPTNSPGTADNITTPSLDWVTGSNSGTNFTISGTTLMNSMGTLTGVFTSLVTTADPLVANVTGTLSAGLAYTPDGGVTSYFNQSYVTIQTAAASSTAAAAQLVTDTAAVTAKRSSILNNGQTILGVHGIAPFGLSTNLASFNLAE